MRNAAGSAFPRNYWDPDFLAYVYLMEFLLTDWEKEIQVQAPPDETRTQREIATLLKRKGKDRHDHLEDIRDQAATFSQVFLRRLMFTSTSHPRTFDVVRVAILVGRAVVMHFKDKYGRRRPPQYSPAIEPVFDVPGHPSYPSGHSTQAHLVAHVLCELHPRGRDSNWRKVLLDLAWDIAVNRERAGVHYRTDSEAGRSLGKQIFEVLVTRCVKFKSLVDEARREWTSGAPRYSGRRSALRAAVASRSSGRRRPRGSPTTRD